MAPAQSPGWRRHFRKQFRKTQLCRFNAVGQCNNGQNCSFAHSPLELSTVPDLTKTALCSAWQKGRCPLAAADCHFAHGSEELRLTPAFDKAGFSQRTRAAKQDFTKLTDDFLSKSTDGSLRSGSVSRESISSCGLTQQEKNSTSPRSFAELKDEALMSRADLRPLLFHYQLPAPVFRFELQRKISMIAKRMIFWIALNWQRMCCQTVPRVLCAVAPCHVRAHGHVASPSKRRVPLLQGVLPSWRMRH